MSYASLSSSAWHLLSLETLGSPLEFKKKLCGFEEVDFQNTWQGAMFFKKKRYEGWEKQKDQNNSQESSCGDYEYESFYGYLLTSKGL